MTTGVGKADPAFITPHRARVIRVGIEMEQRDAIRAGELEATAWGDVPIGSAPMFATREDPPELPAAAKQGVAHSADGRASEPGAATSPAAGGGGTVAARGPSRPCELCGARPARLYPRGWRCTSCQPPAPPTPDPERTAAALRARRERHLRALGGAR